LLPAPAEPHAHLDKAYSADVVANPAGDLGGAITAWLTHRPNLRAAEIVDRARAAVETYVHHGVTAIRTHVDIGTDLGLQALYALRSVRASMVDMCQLQIVALIANPVSGAAGADHRALLADAMATGADLVGGCPALDPDPSACIEACLAEAARHGVGVDLHIDEGLNPEPCTLLMLAQAVRHSGFPGSVTASHCVSLGMMETDRVRQIADEVAAAGIAVICLPQTNLYLQSRDRATATPRGLTAIRALRAAGVRVAAGGDNLQDPFNPLGRADPLETAALLVLAGHDRPDLAYDSVSRVSREVMGLPVGHIRPGDPAELLAIRAGSVREAIAVGNPDRIVIHAGRVIARTTTTIHTLVTRTTALDAIS
jgi:cytosine deaminase